MRRPRYMTSALSGSMWADRSRTATPSTMTPPDLAARAAHVFHLTLVTADAVGIAVCTKAGASCDAVNGMIIVDAGDDGGTVGDSGTEQRILTALGIMDGHGRYADGISTCDEDQRGEGVGDIIASGCVITPMLVEGAPTVDALLVGWVERMIVFAFGKKQITECATAIDATHLAVEFHVGVVFIQHIERLALFGGAHEGYAVCHSGIGGAFAENVDITFQRFDGIRCMLVEEVAQEHRLHAGMLDEAVEVRIASDVTKLFCGFFQLFLVVIADGNDLAVIEQNAVQM